MLQNARDLFGELRGFPVAATSAVTGYARSWNLPNLQCNSDFSIHIHGGALSKPVVYNPWRNFLLTHLQNPPPVYLPRRMIVRASGLAKYSALIPENRGELEIHAGHSGGGFISLRHLATHFEHVARVILVGVPVNAKYVHPLAKEVVGRRIFGINAETPPEYLESLKMIFSCPDMLAKITVISSPGDKFFPPEACYIAGAEYKSVRDCSHVGFIYKEEALQAIHSVVARTIGPYVPKRKAA